MRASSAFHGGDSREISDYIPDNQEQAQINKDRLEERERGNRFLRMKMKNKPKSEDKNPNRTNPDVKDEDEEQTQIRGEREAEIVQTHFSGGR